MSLFSRVKPPTRMIGAAGGRVWRTVRGTPRTDGKRHGQAGQALPLFVLMIFVLTGSVAVVTDVSWFWVNQQKMQRAADAGALAGAVYLPGDPSSAYAAARAATARNGFTNGVGGVTVTPVQETVNRRRLDVTVGGPIGTYFARVFGLTQVQGSAMSKAEFTLPVPMGSPQAWYGVGDFQKDTITHGSDTVTDDTGFDAEGASVAAGHWTNPNNATTNDNNYATESTNGDTQQWTTFGLQGGASGVPNDGTLAIDGLEVDLNDVFIGGSGTSTGCYVKTEVSWNAGTTWTTAQNTSALNTTTTTDKTVGSSSSTSGWGAHTWAYSDFSDANFRVRLTWLNGAGNAGCASTRTVSLDQLTVRVSYHTSVVTTISTPGLGTVTSPLGGTLASQGFWGAIITKGGSRENGDEFSPENDNSGISGHTSTNPEQDDSGYDYAVILPGGNGQVRIYDASFCETGTLAGAGNMGAGDHWIGGSANGVTTVYSLWNENGTPYDDSDDTLVASSGNTFSNQIQADYSGTLGTPGHSGLADCSNPAVDPYHDAWYTLATSLAAGRYRLNVNTSSANNVNTNAENMWSAWVSSGSSPQVYGEGKMVAYNNLPSGGQIFYLAQIDASNAGKTMEITLFDPGDVSGDAYLKIKSPNGNAYNYATFSWTADNGTSGNNVTQIQTASATSGSFFNDRVITIDVPLPNTYGSSGLTPPGEAQAGWWKIEYDVVGGNDTTTWQVGIKGSPVHLVH